MKKVLSTLMAGSAVAATSIVFGSTEAMALSFTSCVGEGYDISGSVSGAVDCTISDAEQDFLNTDPITVNETPGFFGSTNWEFVERGEGAGSGAEGASGTYNFVEDLMEGYQYMAVFKDGNGTTLVGYLLETGTDSITWETPFLNPPFDFNGAPNGKDVSHISIYKSVPEPLTILGAGAAISFGTAFKRKLGLAKNNDKKA
ncbi:PEP-CTERM sorting domain-containing protein [Crocosphaera sp.]|uniref:PEP-CTERM sorting domain-containing protein n=1 Tax=Crocosphaera sp. TaxID=2729996 RepID=UPI003F287237|nr:PEP-CTERM sorting domain-containing protein [Crocosphaera sp.]